MKVSAIIVNYFSSQFLLDLINVLNSEPDIGRVIIVNNSQSDDLSYLIDEFPKVKLIDLDENLGFAKAVNIGIQAIEAEWYLLINPDTLPEQGFTRHLLSAALQHQAKITAPRFYWDKEMTYRLPPSLGYAQWQEIAINKASSNNLELSTFQFNWDIRHSRYWQAEDPFPETFLSGACLLVKNDPQLIKEKKLLDESFFLYFEDTDLFTCAIKQNIRMLCVPQARVVHYWNQSPDEDKNRYMEESKNIYLQKHYPGTANKWTFSDPIEIPFIDLGKVKSVEFLNQSILVNSETVSIEIGVNPLFIPYAQLIQFNTDIGISNGLWNSMKPGKYFIRQRNNYNETINQYSWTKG